MKRSDFLRNCLMSIAISVLPKILQPALPEVIEEAESFDGIIPTIEKWREPHHYKEFDMFTSYDYKNAFEKIIEQLSENKKTSP